MEKTKELCLLKGIVDDVTLRYLVPLTSNQSQRKLTAGDKLKIYNIVEADHLSKKMGKEIIVVSFKKNYSRNITQWCFDKEQFFQNVRLKKTKNLMKFLAEQE